MKNGVKFIVLAEEGYSYRQIVSRVGCSRGSVGEIIKKQKLTGSVHDMPIRGRDRKTTERQDSLLVRKSLACRFTTAPQLNAEMRLEHGVVISTSTTQRLREVGLHGRKPRKKPRFPPLHKRARLELETFSVGQSGFQ